MKSLTVEQMNQISCGSWKAEAACGIGLGALMGWSLSFTPIPMLGMAAVATSLILSGIAAMACHGWFE